MGSNFIVYIGVGKDKPTLKDINNYTVPQLAPQWRKLGVELKFNNYLMNIIEHDHPNDSETCCSKMLSEWLDNNSAATWDNLIAAVANLQADGMFVYITLYQTQN